MKPKVAIINSANLHIIHKQSDHLLVSSLLTVSSMTSLSFEWEDNYRGVIGIVLHCVLQRRHFAHPQISYTFAIYIKLTCNMTQIQHNHTVTFSAKHEGDHNLTCKFAPHLWYYGQVIQQFWRWVKKLSPFQRPCKAFE
mgnify:FL=1